MGRLKFEKGLFSKEAIKCIWEWSEGQRRYILLLSLGNMLISVLALVLSVITKDIVDAAFKGDSDGIIKYALILAGISVAILILAYIFTRLEVYVRAKIVRMLRYKSVEQILNKEYAAVSRYHSGELMNRMFSDIGIVVNGIVDVVPPLASMVTQVVGAALILMRYDATLVLILFLIGIFSFVAIQFFRGLLKAFHKSVQEKEGKVHSAIQETIQNIRLVKASGTEDNMMGQIDCFQGIYFFEQMRKARFTTLAGTGIGMVFRATWLLALVWGCFGISAKTTTYGTLMAVMQLVAQIQGPFADLSSIVQKVIGSVASAERIDELFSLPDDISSEDEGEMPTENISGFSVDIKNVDFSYGRSDIVKDINLMVNSGDFIAVTGPSGGGKSTLLLLLLGVYKPTNGNITFDFGNVKLSAGKNTRRLFAYVPQGNALFSGTIRDNIAMFKPDATDEELINAANIACIDEFILSQKDGLQTAVGERGIGLSEGQAQRIAVARALLGGASVLLLDESTSALDEQTEANLIKNIEKLNNKTCIIVTHRKAALSICNRIIKVENQKLTELKKDD